MQVNKVEMVTIKQRQNILKFRNLHDICQVFFTVSFSFKTKSLLVHHCIYLMIIDWIPTSIVFLQIEMFIG